MLVEDRDGLQIDHGTMTLCRELSRLAVQAPQHSSSTSPNFKGTRVPSTIVSIFPTVYNNPLSLSQPSAAWLYTLQHVVRPSARQRPYQQRRLKWYPARCTHRRTRNYAGHCDSARVQTCGECHVFRRPFCRTPKQSGFD
jgi:hypothetical protein